MRVSDEELMALIPHARGRRRDELLKEMRFRLRGKVLRRLPNPVGTCGHGARVYADWRGAFSSGYVLHEGTHKPCARGYGRSVVWDAPSPQAVRLKRLLADLSG